MDEMMVSVGFNAPGTPDSRIMVGCSWSQGQCTLAVASSTRRDDPSGSIADDGFLFDSDADGGIRLADAIDTNLLV